MLTIDFAKSRLCILLSLAKKLREISSGVCNLIKKICKQGMSAKQFLSMINRNDKHLEANLSTMMQSVCGSKQFWFLRKSELQCMTREFGSPTLFLTFICAEYDSEDIKTYLHRVNNVSKNYPIGKLCAFLYHVIFCEIS